MDIQENMNPEEKEQLLAENTPPTDEGHFAFENNIDEEKENVVMEEPVPARKASPYADSPYLMNEPVRSKPVKVKKKRGFWKKTLCAVLALALVAGSCAATGIVINNYWQERVDNLEESFEDRIEDLEEKLNKAGTGVYLPGSTVSYEGALTPAQVYAMNVNSVVLIRNEVTAKYNGQTSVGVSKGSGFILTEDGYVVTNHHVIDGNGALSVVTYDGIEYEARLIGSDKTNDVALIKVEAVGLQAAKLGSSDELIVGDQVVAIGNPLGELTSTLTVGYISAKERDVNTDGFAINMLQTDAAINSGNSGGPLFNMRGEVIGITTAKYSGTSGGGASIEGVGFAIPIDDVSDLLSDLATYGYATGAYLGVSVSDMDPDAANYYGMPVGAYVQKVEKGFAADRVGIQPKDIITKLDDAVIKTVNDLTHALRKYEAGDEAVITVYRGGRAMELKITLDEKPVEGQ